MNEENKSEEFKKLLPKDNIETDKGLVSVGDKVIANGNEYVIDSISQGFLFTFKLDEKNIKQKLAIHPSMIEEIKPQKSESD